MSYSNRLYVAFDACGNPLAVSPYKDSLLYHDLERVKELVESAQTRNDR